MQTLNVNGQTVEVRAPDYTPLLWVLRCELKLTGTKFGCGVGVCGACAVHVDNEVKLACQLPVNGLCGAKVVTIEGLQGAEARAVRAAWIKEEVAQCGYCQSAQVMAATALLRKTRRPSQQAIDEWMYRYICRCGTYPRIRKALKEAIDTLGGR